MDLQDVDIEKLRRALGDARPGAQVTVDAEALRRLLQTPEDLEIAEETLDKEREEFSDYDDLERENKQLKEENDKLHEEHGDDQRYVSKLEDEIEALKAEVEVWKELLS